jgi:hypothetical protein
VDYKSKLIGLLESENPFTLAKKEKEIPVTTKNNKEKKKSIFTKFKATHSKNVSKEF